jgi:hypothetical protein
MFPKQMVKISQQKLHYYKKSCIRFCGYIAIFNFGEETDTDLSLISGSKGTRSANYVLPHPTPLHQGDKKCMLTEFQGNKAL